MEEEVINCDYVRRQIWSLTKRIALLALLAIVVVGIHRMLGYLGAILAIYFLALAGIYLMRCGYALLQGVIALASRLFGKLEESPRAVWLFAGVTLNVLEIAVCLGLTIYVLRGVGWYTGIELPVSHTYNPIPN